MVDAGEEFRGGGSGFCTVYEIVFSCVQYGGLMRHTDRQYGGYFF